MPPFIWFSIPSDDTILHSSSSNSSCSDGVQWLWHFMGVCAINTREQISAYAGLLSILTWIVVGIPQIIKNFRKLDGMAGVSFLLLFQWTAGDSTNLAGAILTNQLKPQIYLAVYFVMTDIVLQVQYLCYFIKTRRRQNGAAIIPASRAVLCLLGFVSLSHCFASLLVPSLTPESDSRHLPSGGRVSRFLLSKDIHSSLVYKSEADLSNSEFDPLSGGFDPISSSQRASPTFWHNTKDIIGYVIGCVSSVFYIGSRLAQIYKNYTKKSTEGLAIMMFILAVLGNIFYGAQILIQDLHKEFLLEHTPWIIGSLGVVFLDCTLLWQFRHYSRMNRRLDEARQSLLSQDDYTVNSDIYGHQSISPQPHQHGGFTDSLY